MEKGSRPTHREQCQRRARGKLEISPLSDRNMAAPVPCQCQWRPCGKPEPPSLPSGSKAPLPILLKQNQKRQKGEQVCSQPLTSNHSYAATQRLMGNSRKSPSNPQAGWCQQRPREGPESAALLSVTRNHSQLGSSGKPGLPPVMWKKKASLTHQRSIRRNSAKMQDLNRFSLILFKFSRF